MAKTDKKTDIAQPNFDLLAGSGDGEDITAGYVGALRVSADKLLLSKGGDLSVYERVYDDDQVMTCWQQRRRALTSREWHVEPGGNSARDKAAAAFVREQFESLKFDSVTTKMLNALFYGYAVGECMWATDGRWITLDAIKVRKSRRFRFGRDGELRLLTKEKPEGVAMPDRKFWVFTAGADNDDDPYGLGLAHWLYWPVWFKRNGIKFWSIFMEKFATPTVMGIAPQGASREERNKLMQAMRAMTTDSGVVVPEGTKIELVEAARRASGDYATFYKMMDAAIAKVCLSQTMTTENGSSRSQAEVHQDVKLEVVKGDADLICESLNDGPVRWLVDWNFPGAAYPKVWRDCNEPEDMKAAADRDKVLHDMGWQLTEDRVRDTYGDGYEKRQARNSQEETTDFADDEEQTDTADDLTDQLDQVAGGAMDAMLGRIKAVLDEAESLEEAADKLFDLYPDLPTDDLARVIGEAMATADLAGRHEVM